MGPTWPRHSCCSSCFATPFHAFITTSFSLLLMLHCSSSYFAIPSTLLFLLSCSFWCFVAPLCFATLLALLLLPLFHRSSCFAWLLFIVLNCCSMFRFAVTHCVSLLPIVLCCCSCFGVTLWLVVALALLLLLFRYCMVRRHSSTLRYSHALSGTSLPLVASLSPCLDWFFAQIGTPPAPFFLQGVGDSNLELIGRKLESIQAPSCQQVSFVLLFFNFFFLVSFLRFHSRFLFYFFSIILFGSDWFFYSFVILQGFLEGDFSLFFLFFLPWL